MTDLHSILATHNLKRKASSEEETKSHYSDVKPQFSQIPNVFFDDILVNYKLNRIELSVLLFLYRQVWCRPNLYQEYGLTQIMSYTQISNFLSCSMDEVYQALMKLEKFYFIETIRSGQYFVRKYFTPEMDEYYGMTYDDF